MFKNIVNSKLFYFGVALRVAAIVLFSQTVALDYYIPFIEATKFSPFDPWFEWTSTGGSSLAFPYGYSMWMLFWPLSIITSWLNLEAVFGYFATLFIFELLAVSSLQQLSQAKPNYILLFFWLSPIPILVSYVYGFNDIVPVSLLLLSLQYIKKMDWRLSALFVTLAASAKLSMLISLPVLALYFINNKNLHIYILPFAKHLVTFGILFSIPFALSNSGISMLFSNPELGKLLELKFNFFDGELLVVPFVFSMFLFWIWRIRRMNIEMLLSLQAISFMGFTLFIPSVPGWFLWSLPFLVFHELRGQKHSIILVQAYSLVYCLFVFTSNPPIFDSLAIDIEVLSMRLTSQYFGQVDGTIYTVLVAVGILSCIDTFHRSIANNSFFLALRRPFVIGIAGDSSTGKDTLASALVELLGPKSTINLSGDDYHKYDRNKKIWNVVTHLNPVANHLDIFYRDVAKLRAGQPISKRHYDHVSGILGNQKNILSGDFIIVSGLHALMFDKLRSLYDLRVFLEMEDSLKQYFKLRRDVLFRNKTVRDTEISISRRRPDYLRFIQPQADAADVVFTLSNSALADINADPASLDLSLSIKLKRGNSEDKLIRAMIGICECSVIPYDTTTNDHIGFKIAGRPNSSQIALAANKICPEMAEFYNQPTFWKEGMLGLIQLTMTVIISGQMSRRGRNETI